jgi:hypothetical protein
MLSLLMDRWAVNDALGDALGRQVTSQVDFTPHQFVQRWQAIRSRRRMNAT